ncbi:thiamine-phosphate kinase [uncultured Sphingomonas sp.]|uniref:thiamine-phosphate kinase n=1 Tax=uncultured Sphingomonas sp. TaxID=158754 RepID=UPI00260AC4A1|nr:thiamine-phosphate kinase [uncultured Sphingomonas sp.]
MDERAFLDRLRALPLHPGAGGLRDDTAQLAGLVVSTDTMVEGVHFLASDPAGDVAWRLVATNLSDLAAKGARVEGVLLNYPLSDAAWDDAFLRGFGEVLARFDARLLGGDTVTLPRGAPRVLTLTAFGADAPAPTRSGARAGDGLWVTGTIGDAAPGLAIARRGEARGDDEAYLLARYRRPTPRLAVGRTLAPHVHAMMDVSDGLLLDATRMAEASGLSVTVELDAVPLSPAARAYGLDALAAATAGDDYELLFAAPLDWTPPAPATLAGRFAAGAGLSLTDRGMAVRLPDHLGYQHSA